MPQSAEQKRKNVETLTAERAKRSPQEQLKTLDFRLGKGQGAKKERARLQALIDNKHKKPTEEVVSTPVVETPEELKAKREARKAEKKAAKRAAKAE